MEESATSPMKIELPDGIDMLEEFIVGLLDQQISMERTGKYVEAETLRLKVAHSKKELEKRKENEMEDRHRRERYEVEKAHNDEMNQFNQFWDKKAQELTDEAKKCELKAEMEAKHRQDQQALRQDLEKSIPLRYKESSELLNLKKMEEHMAKQKNYVEAHKVQTKINSMDKEENESWLNARANKIQTAINQLKAKEANELLALKKRISTSRDEQTKDRTVQQERITQKYLNVKKELTAQHEKELLAFKGQFRSKASVSSPGSNSKSRN